MTFEKLVLRFIKLWLMQKMLDSQVNETIFKELYQDIMNYEKTR